jgi:hypothetical protein
MESLPGICTFPALSLQGSLHIYLEDCSFNSLLSFISLIIPSAFLYGINYEEKYTSVAAILWLILFLLIEYELPRDRSVSVLVYQYIRGHSMTLRRPGTEKVDKTCVKE